MICFEEEYHEDGHFEIVNSGMSKAFTYGFVRMPSTSDLMRAIQSLKKAA